MSTRRPVMRMAPRTVRSEPLENGERVEKRQRGVHWDRVPLVLIGLLLLGLWWVAGARYTIDGLPLLGNMILDFLHAPQPFLPVTDWHVYAWLFWLPIAISYVERRNRPWRLSSFSTLAIYAVGIWAVVIALDAGSTWLAVTTPRPDDWRISHQLAEAKPLAAAWTALTTFVPEVGIAALWAYLRR